MISHDDRYFHLADRVVHMSAGRIAGNRVRAGRETLAA